MFQTSESCIKLHAVVVLELLLSEQCPLLQVFVYSWMGQIQRTHFTAGYTLYNCVCDKKKLKTYRLKKNKKKMSPSLNESLATSVVPIPFKKSVIIPVPKNSKPSCLNDYRPVALTSTVMKVFERLLKKHICSSIPATLDPLQFAYRPNRSTDDAISQVLHSSLTHIDSKNGNYVRLLFIDYSSAFNTIVPTKLAVKLSDLGLNTSLCDWIQDFLTARPQVVKVGQFTSNSITLNIGAPQGCVLSPLLYSLYTHDCVSSAR